MYSNKHNAKEYPNKREHTATLRRFYIMIPTGASHKHLHINPNEKKTGKRVATSLLRVDPQHDCPELVPRASRARTSRQRAPLDQRALLDHVHRSTMCTSRHVHLSATCASRALAPLDNSPRSSPLVRAFPARLTASSFPSPLRLHTPHPLSNASLSTHAPRPPFGRVASAPPIARTRHPSPLPFLASETGR